MLYPWQLAVEGAYACSGGDFSVGILVALDSMSPGWP